MNYKISVILPVHNAENSLKNTIASVINQTIGFKNIELIIVDDCSADSSKNIINEFSSKYSNIKPIFLNENTGSPVKPRNIGIEYATSNYLMFLDSDDEYTHDCFEILYNIAEKEHADLVQCIYLRKIDEEFYVYNHINEKNTDFVEVLDILRLRGTVWGNLFKTSLIKNKIIFKDVLHEDGVFLLECSIEANKIIELPNFYGYIYSIENNDSITHNISFNSIKQYINGFKLQNTLLEKNNIKKDNYFNSNIPMIYFMFFKFKGSKDEKLKIMDEIKIFENTLNYPIKLKSKPINILNNLVLTEQYSKALIMAKIASILYNSETIKNFIFKRYSNIKKINIME